MQLEICVFSLDSAIKAFNAGADRIELCSNPAEGGTTPNHSLIKAARKATKQKIVPIIRPRGGNFCYSSDEFEMMKEDILFCKEVGCDGIATAIQKPDYTVDEIRLKELVNTAYPMEVTFIRAFDLTTNPAKALQSVINAGCQRILTSGQATKASDAIPFIKKLVMLAGNHISIMPGGGIRPENLKNIVEQTGVNEVHASARIILPNKNSKIDQFGFGNIITCDETQITTMKKILDTF
ncbi:copper homeostasis protein CutC [Thermophagus sp. OGC60D27]|uniref:copper homeostasis protein CutC n=1 Tax=Thermophagus sp. OGC60D27 TaxID=3458415 RepID=UPI0040377C2D